MQNFAPIKTILGKFRSKIKMLSTENLLCWKFTLVCRNSVVGNLGCLSKKCNFLAAAYFFLTQDATLLQKHRANK